jgi:hypothetical protein
MDEVKDKFRGLFAKASNAAKQATSKKFQGRGNRLGTAEVCKVERAAGPACTLLAKSCGTCEHVNIH